MPPKDKIEFSGTISVQEAAQYLESLAKGLRERSMLLESGDVSFNVEIPDEVKIEIEVGNDVAKGKSNIEVSLSWRQRRQEEEAVASPGLLIVAGAAAHSEAPTFVE